MNKSTLIQQYYQTGIFAHIDLLFSSHVQKKIQSDDESHALLLATMFAFYRQGHMALEISEQSLVISAKLLGIAEAEQFVSIIQKAASTFPSDALADETTRNPTAWIYRFKTYFYLKKNWMEESHIISHLHRLNNAPSQLPSIYPLLDERLNQLQKEAVFKALQNGLLFLTGGPGTGKTFTAAEIVKACLFSAKNESTTPYRILLAAPTGKAIAQLDSTLKNKLKEVPFIVSGTLHSILGMKKSRSNQQDLIPLFADLIIVDECSMIDAPIFAQFLAAIQTGTKLILIGDKDQLPSIDAGSVFADLLDACCFPITKLEECHRSNQSDLPVFAQFIKEGNHSRVLEFLEKNQSDAIRWNDFQKLGTSSLEIIAGLWDLYNEKFPSFYVNKPDPDKLISDLGRFVIISCMRQGPLGVDELNRYFLSHYSNTFDAQNWWVAPVIITRNDYELDLYNGDLGLMVRKISDKQIPRELVPEDYILFTSRKGGYRTVPALAIKSFEFCYCLSVHKCQGSEYDEALVLAPKGSEVFGREILYTAMTRVRSRVTLAADRETLRQIILNSSRKTSGLKARLQINY